jgi:hypothetical protein
LGNRFTTCRCQGVCTQTQETFGRLGGSLLDPCLLPQSCNCKPSTRPSRYIHMSACLLLCMYVYIHIRWRVWNRNQCLYSNPVGRVIPVSLRAANNSLVKPHGRQLALLSSLRNTSLAGHSPPRTYMHMCGRCDTKAEYVRFAFGSKRIFQFKRQ